MKTDKLLHIVAGLLLGFAGAIGFKSFSGGLAMAGVAGGGKELLDWKFGGTAEMVDFLATLAGGAIGAALASNLGGR